MKLFIRRFGKGFPVIILHGLLGVSDNWVSFGRRLAGGFDVVVPDLRNHGQSPHSPLFDYPSLSGDLADLVDELGFDEFFLIGHSLGGKVSMLYALEHPEKVRKLVVVDISMRKYATHTQQQQLVDAMTAVDFSGIRSRSEVEKVMSQTISSSKLRQFLLKNAYWRDKEHLDWRINLAAINENLPAIFEGISATSTFAKPALFIRGGMSDYISEDDIPMIMEHFPNAGISTIKNASHWVHADEPEEFFRIVERFLTA